MELNAISDLLSQAKHFFQPEREVTIFDAGSRNYYENPTSDLLAFFLDPNKSHGLGDAFLRALLSCLPDSENLDSALRMPPQREVTTGKGKRIDLVLGGHDWDLVIELKIFHSQVNPFDEYQSYVEKYVRGEGRRLIYLVISPRGKAVTQGWQGLSYQLYIEAVKQQLAEGAFSQPLHKWQILAREFLLHLENIAVEHAMDDKAVRFVFEHMSEIDKLVKLKEKAVDDLDKRVVSKLVSEVEGYKVTTRRHSWKAGPALRYGSGQWKSSSDVVLYLNASEATLQPRVRVYLFAMNPSLDVPAKELFTTPNVRSWTEQGGKVLAFSWLFEDFDEQRILEAMVEKMRLLIEFEQSIRPVHSA